MFFPTKTNKKKSDDGREGFVFPSRGLKMGGGDVKWRNPISRPVSAARRRERVGVTRVHSEDAAAAAAAQNMARGMPNVPRRRKLRDLLRLQFLDIQINC